MGPCSLCSLLPPSPASSDTPSSSTQVAEVSQVPFCGAKVENLGLRRPPLAGSWVNLDVCSCKAARLGLIADAELQFYPDFQLFEFATALTQQDACMAPRIAETMHHPVGA